jgi:hypothetical protein
MVKRKRVALNLTGTDEQYFRTKEISGQAVPNEPDNTKQTKAVSKRQDPKVEKTANVPVHSKQLKTSPKKVGPKDPDEQPKGEIISRIIHLGRPLSKRIQDTAEKFGVPVDDLLFAARKKAITNFREKLSARKRPVIDAFDKGGETIRIAVSLSPSELSQLEAWFDPLSLGLGTKMVSPLLTKALRSEVIRICDAAE